nr:MAG TPA: Lethal factor [Caudoviricetes sp.]
MDNQLAKKLGHAFKLGLAFSLGMRARRGVAQDEAKWITVHPNGKGATKSGDKAKGQPVLIDGETGEVLGGMGGKFTGRHISAVPKRGKEEQHGAQAKIDRKHALGGNKSDSEPKPQSVPEFVSNLSKQGVQVSIETFRDVEQGLQRQSLGKLSELISKVDGLGDFFKNNPDFSLALDNQRLKGDELGRTVSRSTGQGLQKVTLNSIWYRDAKKLIDETKRCVEIGHFMPCDETELGAYTIAHEFGHVLHNVLFTKEVERRIQNGETFRFLNFGQIRSRVISQIRSDVLKLAMKETGDRTMSAVEQRYVSAYGRSSRAEFIAEAVANAYCGKPNPVGKAMAKYIEGLKL